MSIFHSREFYYIQMEKYARQCLSEGLKHPEDIQVNLDAELYRVINLHYNRNNHIEVRVERRRIHYESKLNMSCYMEL